MQFWKTLSRQMILDHGKFLVVEDHTVELPDGQIIADWPWLITPDYIIVVAVTDDERFLCFRQPKYGYAGMSLAVVGGYIEPGEDPLAAAQRELREETGHEATAWTALGHFVVDANRGAGTAHLYLARGAHRVSEPIRDDLEEQEHLRLTRVDVEAALRNNEFKVLPWAAALALALQHISE